MRIRFESEFGEFDIDDGVLDAARAQLAAAPDVPPVRLVYAAAHLCLTSEYAEVGHRLGERTPAEEIAPYIDWDRTLDLRRRLNSLGFGIAEAMDTAQRFQIGWENASQLIERTGALKLSNGFVAGAGVDHLDSIDSEAELIAGVVFQARAIQSAGGIPILLPLLWLSERGSDEETFVRVYEGIVAELEGPLFVHWLGEMFMLALAGYFPGRSFERIMALDPSKVRGAKLSLLDADLEKRLRKTLLDSDQIMLTGDDFHFGELMAGGPVTRTTSVGDRDVALGEFSHGLLGIFDGVAEPANLALKFLAHGDDVSYRSLMEACERLGQHLFEAPTQHYKAGLAFLSWLIGSQPNRMLVQHEELARSTEHFVKAVELASLAGVIVDAPAAHKRLSEFVELALGRE